MKTQAFLGQVLHSSNDLDCRIFSFFRLCDYANSSFYSRFNFLALKILNMFISDEIPMDEGAKNLAPQKNELDQNTKHKKV